MTYPVLKIVKKYRKTLIIGALWLLLALIPSIYFFRQYQKAQTRLDNPAASAKQDSQKTIADIGKLMMLPADEEPTIATVTDLTKLKDQPFFVNAKNGDKVIIYAKAKKAILYRPEANIIIDVSPVNIGTPSAITAAPPAETPVPATPSATPQGAK